MDKTVARREKERHSWRKLLMLTLASALALCTLLLSGQAAQDAAFESGDSYYSLIESLQMICWQNLRQTRRRPQSIMDIYGQGLQRCMAQILPESMEDFY